MSIVLVTGTGTDIGKTIGTAALAAALREAEEETGLDPDRVIPLAVMATATNMMAAIRASTLPSMMSPFRPVSC